MVSGKTSQSTGVVWHLKVNIAVSRVINQKMY